MDVARPPGAPQRDEHGRRFKSSTTKQKGTYSVRFAQSGTFRYHCTIHPGMNGSVVVR